MFLLAKITVDILAYCRPHGLVASAHVAVDAKMSGKVCRAQVDDEGHVGCIGDCRRVRPPVSFSPKSRLFTAAVTKVFVW